MIEQITVFVDQADLFSTFRFLVVLQMLYDCNLRANVPKTFLKYGGNSQKEILLIFTG